MKVTRTGAWCTIDEIRDREAVYRVLDHAFSYRIAGAKFSDLYRRHAWDGKEHLVRKSAGTALRYPSGLHEEVVATLKSVGYSPDMTDTRKHPDETETRGSPWGGPEMRDYQNEAVSAALSAGRGVLKLPIRSGKTLTAARLVWTMRQATLFVVTNDLLLRQAAEVFRAALPRCTTTLIGGGEWDDDGDVVVATVQTLLSRHESRQFNRLSGKFGVLFADEIHHISSGPGRAWREVILSLDIRVKFGLSATAEVHPTEENEAGDIWLRGICGPVVHEREMSDLIERKFLVPASVRFVRHDAPVMYARAWSSLTYQTAVSDCEPRNRRIASETAKYALRGLGVLVDVARIKQARTLLDMCARMLPPGQVALLLGSTSPATREKLLAHFRMGKVKVLVSTILGEGIDIPEIHVVVNAEGGRSRSATIQRLRCLTPAPGKTEGIVVEMVDLHHPQLAMWTGERLRTYKAERGFSIDIEPKD